MLPVANVQDALSSYTFKIDVPMLSPHAALSLTVICAVITYLLYKRYEFDTRARNIAIHALLLGALPALCTNVLESSLHHSCASSSYICRLLSARRTSTIGFSLYYTVFFASLVSYRLSPWHPYANVPGPIFARISSFWLVFHTAKGKNHELLLKLHRRYGSYVRIGPNEVSMVDLDAMPSVLGIDGMVKGPMWEPRRPPGLEPTILSLRDPIVRSQRRRLWKRAFTPMAVREYEPFMHRRVLQLVEVFEKLLNEGTKVDLPQWLSSFAFGFMGDITYGGWFDVLHGDENDVEEILSSLLRITSMIEHLPWLAPILRRFTSALKILDKYVEVVTRRTMLRKKNGSVVKDIFHYLMDEDGVQNVCLTDKQLVSEAAFAIAAGSETTTSVLPGIFFYLLVHPCALARLQEEIDIAFDSTSAASRVEDDDDGTKTRELIHSKLANLPFLNACINEAMRLQPPVTTRLQRMPLEGSGGKMVGNLFVPERSTVVVPPYVLHREPRYFSPAPDSFWPERWLAKDIRYASAHAARVPPAPFTSDYDAVSKQAPVPPDDSSSNSSLTELDLDVMTNFAAFIPFSMGPAMCGGKRLALLELRTVVAHILRYFHVRLAEVVDAGGESKEVRAARKWREGLHDWFTLHTGSLEVVLESRRKRECV